MSPRAAVEKISQNSYMQISLVATLIGVIVAAVVAWARLGSDVQARPTRQEVTTEIDSKVQRVEEQVIQSRRELGGQLSEIRSILLRDRGVK